jgi:hypothetical protein
MKKLTRRKAFNFLRSYFDVLNELTEDSDKLEFLLAIINKQFLDEDPKDLKFISNLCYESQRHQIESSVKGWKRVSKEYITDTPSTNPPTNPPTNPKEEEEEVKEEEKVKEKVESNRKTILVFESYNKFAEKHNIPKIQKFTASRKKLALARLKDPEDLKTVFQKISESEFLLGGSFSISFDWIFKQANFNKILEGNYDNKIQAQKKQKRSAADALREKVYGTSNN